MFSLGLSLTLASGQSLGVPGAEVDNLLLETGDNLLLETGDVLLLE